jgi:hypothetical protein
VAGFSSAIVMKFDPERVVWTGPDGSVLTGCSYRRLTNEYRDAVVLYDEKFSYGGAMSSESSNSTVRARRSSLTSGHWHSGGSLPCCISLAPCTLIGAVMDAKFPRGTVIGARWLTRCSMTSYTLASECCSPHLEEASRGARPRCAGPNSSCEVVAVCEYNPVNTTQ